MSANVFVDAIRQYGGNVCNKLRSHRILLQGRSAHQDTKRPQQGRLMLIAGFDKERGAGENQQLKQSIRPDRISR